jgi:hypothetical protein
MSTKNPQRISTRIALPEGHNLTIGGRMPEGMGATHLRVSLYYSKPGINYFTYNREAGGYWLAVTPVQVEQDGPARIERSILMGENSGFKVLLAPATRFNARKLAALQDHVASLHDQLVAAIVQQDKAALHATIQTMKAAA